MKNNTDIVENLNYASPIYEFSLLSIFVYLSEPLNYPNGEDIEGSTAITYVLQKR